MGYKSSRYYYSHHSRRRAFLCEKKKNIRQDKIATIADSPSTSRWFSNQTFEGAKSALLTTVPPIVPPYSDFLTNLVLRQLFPEPVLVDAVNLVQMLDTTGRDSVHWKKMPRQNGHKHDIYFACWLIATLSKHTLKTCPQINLHGLHNRSTHIEHKTSGNLHLSISSSTSLNMVSRFSLALS